VHDSRPIKKATPCQTIIAMMVSALDVRGGAQHLKQSRTVFVRQQFVKIDTLELKAPEPSGRPTLPSSAGRSSGIPDMRYLTDGFFLLVRTASRGTDDHFRDEMGRGAKVLLILASSLALASIAWFLVGLLMN
jgi:hypothetical protein